MFGRVGNHVINLELVKYFRASDRSQYDLPPLVFVKFKDSSEMLIDGNIDEVEANITRAFNAKVQIPLQVGLGDQADMLDDSTRQDSAKDHSASVTPKPEGPA